MRVGRPSAFVLCSVQKVLVIEALSGALQWSTLDEGLHVVQKLLGALAGWVHDRGHGAGIDSVDGGALGQLAAPGARHGLERGLGAAVHGLAAKAETGGDRTDVDNATRTVGGEVRDGGLDKKEGAQDVDGISFVEFLHRDGFDGHYGGEAGIVDQDIDLKFARLWMREVVLRRGD